MLDAAGPRSLVLVDELGRATGTSDGVSIAWAMAERLLEAGALTLFATHFGALAAGLAARYPPASLWRMDCDVKEDRRAGRMDGCLLVTPLRVVCSTELCARKCMLHDRVGLGTIQYCTILPCMPQLQISLNNYCVLIAIFLRLDFKWTVAAAGVSGPASHYGLALAVQLGMPQSLIAAARVVSQAVAAAQVR